MTGTSEESRRSVAAAFVLIEGRDPIADRPEILVNLDRLIALVLLACMDRDPKKALGMLHEGIVPMAEERIMVFEKAGKR
jgi:hypothetical protein